MADMLLRIALAALVLASTGCTNLVTAEREEPTPTPVPIRIDEGKQIYEVQRGSIFDTIKALGRIVGKDESPLYFKQAGRLRSVNVEVMQPVRKGDLLAELDTGDLKWRIETARLQMEIQQIEMARQIAQTANVKADVKAAAASLISAQSDVTRSANNLSKLESGPLPADAAAAEAAVDAARAQVQRADAQLSLLKQPPANEGIVAAQAAVERARATLQQAQAAYDRIAWRPEAAGSSQAVALEQATIDYQTAQSALIVARQGAKAEDVGASTEALRSAQENQRAAEARLAQIRSGARAEDLAGARTAAAKATAALAETRAAFEVISKNAEIDTATFDVAMAQKRVDVAKVKHDGLQAELEMARIRAPYDGVIMFVTGKQGDSFEAFAPIAIISNPTTLIVSVELPSQDMARVAPAQEAIVLAEKIPGTEIRGKVLTLPSIDAAASGPLSGGSPRGVKISFEPPKKDGLLGQLAQVTIITQQKDNIILIPNTAVRRFGSRKYVQMVGPDGRRRDVDVEVGLVTETETEITKGLREGQQVIVQ